MQVGDYVSATNFNIVGCVFIGLIVNKQIDGYYHIEWESILFVNSLKHATIARFHPTPRNYLTASQIKPYHPTLEELFIFKSFKEQSC